MQKIAKFWRVSRVWNGTEKECPLCTVEEALNILQDILCTSAAHLTHLRELAYKLQQDIIYNQADTNIRTYGHNQVREPQEALSISGTESMEAYHD